MAYRELQCLRDPNTVSSQEMRPIAPSLYFDCTNGFPSGVPGGGITGVPRGPGQEPRCQDPLRRPDESRRYRGRAAQH
jgi:hypothetical protein